MSDSEKRLCAFLYIACKKLVWYVVVEENGSFTFYLTGILSFCAEVACKYLLCKGIVDQ